MKILLLSWNEMKQKFNWNSRTQSKSVNLNKDIIFAVYVNFKSKHYLYKITDNFYTFILFFNLNGTVLCFAYHFVCRITGSSQFNFQFETERMLTVFMGNTK